VQKVEALGSLIGHLGLEGKGQIRDEFIVEQLRQHPHKEIERY
jgi:hypothetical protein